MPNTPAIPKFKRIDSKSALKLTKLAKANPLLRNRIVRAVRKDVRGFIEKTFSLTPEESAKLRAKMTDDAAEMLSSAYVMALQSGGSFELVFKNDRRPAPQKNMSVTGYCKTSGECGVRVEWQC